MSAIRNLRRKLVTAVEPSLERVAEPGQQVVERERARSASPAMHLVDGAVDKASQSSSDRCGPGIVGARDDMDAWVSEHLDAEFREILQFRELVRDRWVTNRLRREHVGTHRLRRDRWCRREATRRGRRELPSPKWRAPAVAKPWMVVIVAASKSATACSRRSSRRLAIAGGQESKELVGGRDVRGPAAARPRPR